MSPTRRAKDSETKLPVAPLSTRMTAGARWPRMPASLISTPEGVEASCWMRAAGVGDEGGVGEGDRGVGLRGGGVCRTDAMTGEGEEEGARAGGTG